MMSFNPRSSSVEMEVNGFLRSVIIGGMINKALAWEDEKQKCFCTMGVSSFATVLSWEWDESQLPSSGSQ
ncbi:hypothetical protein KY285_019363 [Solanum tuberosum]|nr:hypothetical protein KY285_019363 [Solanum tuberosum]